MSNEARITSQQGGGREHMQARPVVTPPVDVYENADELLITADLPGASSESLNIRLDKEQIFLSARREDKEHGTALMGQRAAWDYQRAFVVPRGIDAERISAELVGGVLKVHLPKSAALKPRLIEVKAS